MLGHVEIAEDIRPEGPFELLRRNFERLLHDMLLGGVVHQDVEPPEGLDRPGDGLLAKGLVADVASQREGLPALRLDEPNGFLRVVVLIEIDDGDGSALPCHAEGNRPTDPAVAAGDECNLLLQPTDTGKARLGLRARRHLRLAAGLARLRLRRVGVRHGRAFLWRWPQETDEGQPSGAGAVPARSGTMAGSAH